MAKNRKNLDLNTEANKLLLNPQMLMKDANKLLEVAYVANEKLNLKSHVWIATSGSTASSVAASKLVAISKEALKQSALAVNAHLQATEEDVWAQVLPNFHVGGLGIEVRAELSGSMVLPALRNNKWDPDYFHHIVEEDGCTLTALVPTQVFDLVQKKLKSPKSLRAIVVGGAALSVELYDQARALGWPLLPSYGMSETASQIATASLDSLRNFEYPPIQLLQHAQVRTNADGYLEVFSTSLFTAYAQQTEEGVRIWSPRTADGWFTTEDKGEVRDSTLQVFGRSKDYIKIGGEAINIAEHREKLEKVVNALNPQWSTEVTLLDLPSERLGSELHLVTTLSEDIAFKIAEAYSEQVLPFAKARKTHYVSQIPRSELGKILWVQLRNLL